MLIRKVLVFQNACITKNDVKPTSFTSEHSGFPQGEPGYHLINTHKTDWQETPKPN